MSRVDHARRMALVLGAIALALFTLACASSTRSALGSATRRPGPPAVVRTPAVTAGSRYLALGDSNAFGYAEPNAVPTPDYAHPATLIGFPELLASALRVRVANLSCPGETTGSLISVKAQGYGCENIGSAPGYRSTYPLHFRYSGSQLGEGVRYLRTHPRTRLVSLMIGANDLGRCTCTTKAAIAGLDAHVSGNVARILRAIRRAGYSGQIVVVTNYDVDYHAAYRDAMSSMNRVTVATARRFGAEIADAYSAFYAHARGAGDDACAAGIITKLADGTCGGHPNAFGQALLARTILDAIRH